MKKVVLTIGVLFIYNGLFAQTSEKEFLKKTEEIIAKISQEKPNGWEKKECLLF